MNTPVLRLLDSKGHKVITIGPDHTILEAVVCMNEHGVGSLVVRSGDAQGIEGILTEKDCRNTILEEKNPKEAKVKNCMSRELITVSKDETLEKCMQIMTECRVRHLPVMDRESLVGIISIGDVVKYLLSERSQMIENLEKYITGSI